MSFPNPWDSPDYWRTVKIGGRLIKALLVALDGNEIADDWSAQAPTGSSGATNVFKGTKAPGPAKLTFESVNREDFDDLRELWDLLAPKAGSGGTGTGASKGSAGSAAAGKQYVVTSTNTSAAVSTSPDDLLKAAQSALAAVQSGANTAAAASAATTTSSAAASSGAAQPNPGPKPPTLSLVNGYFNYVGINAISRSRWKGPYPTATNSYRVDLEVVTQKEPTPAAVGKSSPKTPDNPGSKTIAFGDIQDPASNAKAFNAGAAAAGAMT